MREFSRPSHSSSQSLSNQAPRLFSDKQPVVSREVPNPSQGQRVPVVEGQRQAAPPGAQADVAAGDQRLQLGKIVNGVGADADIELHPVEAVVIFATTLVEIEDPVMAIAFVEDNQI